MCHKALKQKAVNMGGQEGGGEDEGMSHVTIELQDVIG